MASKAVRSASAGEIVKSVDRLLGGNRVGKLSVERFNGLVAEVVGNLTVLATGRKRLQQRPGTQFYINVSKAKAAKPGSTLSLSVRVRGIECGKVKIGPDSGRCFLPSNRRLFGDCGFDEAKGKDWGHRSVASYIKAAVAEETKGKPEADVEFAFVREMKKPHGEWGEKEQPVCLEGLSLQVPLPIGASGAGPCFGDGHIDVLARHGLGGRTLRVYELKAPTFKTDVSGALDQAVAYAAALRVLLTQSDTARSLPWWKLIGFSRIPKRLPKLEAIALVVDSEKNRAVMKDALRRLGEVEGITLRAQYYDWSAARRLKLIKG